MQIIPIHPHKAYYWWESIEKILLPAIKYAAGKYTIEDVKNDVMQNKSQVWIAYDGEIMGAAITQVANYPQKDMLIVICLAGKSFELWDNKLVEELVLYAKRIKCKGIEFLGRSGWVKMAAHLGFKPIHYLYELAIKDEE